MNENFLDGSEAVLEAGALRESDGEEVAEEEGEEDDAEEAREG